MAKTVPAVDRAGSGEPVPYPEGNRYYWDLLLLEKVRAEENITLLLNTDVTEVEADGPAEARVTRRGTDWMSGSERRITLEARRRSSTAPATDWWATSPAPSS